MLIITIDIIISMSLHHYDICKSLAFSAVLAYGRFLVKHSYLFRIPC